MNVRKARGFLLVELLTALFAVAAGGTLMTMGVVSLLRSQERVARFTNRYAGLNDLLAWVRRDVRHASTMELSAGGQDGALQTLVLRSSTGETIYRVYADRVHRVQDGPGAIGEKLWDRSTGEASFVGERDEAGNVSTLRVTVVWRDRQKKYPAPTRRFEMVLRCAREMRDE